MTVADLDLLDSLIDRLDEFFVAGGFAEDLPVGLSEAQIAEQEELLGWRLPVEVRHFYTRHDGYVPAGTGYQGGLNFYLLPTPPVRLADGVKSTHFTRKLYEENEAEGYLDVGVEAIWPPGRYQYGKRQDPTAVDCTVPGGHVTPVIRNLDFEPHRFAESFTQLVHSWVRRFETGYFSFVPGGRQRNGIDDEAHWPPDVPRSLITL